MAHAGTAETGPTLSSDSLCLVTDQLSPEYGTLLELGHTAALLASGRALGELLCLGLPVAEVVAL